MTPHPFSSLTLQELYIQVRSPNPLDTFALHPDYTQNDLKTAYHALALRLHPDKCALDTIRELHTDLFKHVQSAFEKLSDKSDPPPETPSAAKTKTKAQYPHPKVETELFRCSWTAEESRAVFRKFEMACQSERAMWERIEMECQAVHMNRKGPRMTKETAERVRNSRKVKQARFSKM